VCVLVEGGGSVVVVVRRVVSRGLRKNVGCGAVFECGVLRSTVNDDNKCARPAAKSKKCERFKTGRDA
jgi:hypothetical protein